jgi:hypothetical protein
VSKRPGDDPSHSREQPLRANLSGETTHDSEAWLAKLDARIAASKHTARRTHDAKIAAQARVAREPTIFVASPHPAALPEEQLLRGCTIGKARSGGPGGQNRNKVETTVVLTHNATGVESHAGERRTSMENRRVAIARLRLLLAVCVRCVVPTGDARSDLWKRRCPQQGSRAGRIIVSTTHEDFAAMLAEGLDFLHACQFDPALAATRLCCTTSQLVKLVKDHPPALVWLNTQRAATGLHPLR